MSFSYYQRRCSNWAVECFGMKVVMSKKERTLRFTEEALELAQSMNLEKEDVLKILDRVYSRPKEADPQKEVGGVMVTLAVLCNTAGIYLGTAAESGLAYCMKHMKKIRDSHRQKELDGVAVDLTDLK